MIEKAERSMIDVNFLNEKATKLKSGIKSINTILGKGENEFVNTPMYPDRIKYYLITIYDILNDISCHLLKEIDRDKFNRESCIEDITKIDIFSEKMNRTLTDFINFRRKLFESGFSYSERELFYLSKDIVETIDNLFIKELARVVRDMKEKYPRLKIPVNLVKINKNLSVMKGEVKRLQTFKNLSFEEFSKDRFAIDRARYFLTAYIDSGLWVCRHIARQVKIQTKRCFLGLSERGIISVDIADTFQQIADNREILANPIQHIDLNWLYDVIHKLPSLTDRFIRELSNSILEKV